jgi:oligopeptidase B
MNQSSVRASRARSRAIPKIHVPNPRSETYIVNEHGYQREINYGWLNDARYGRRLRNHIRKENIYVTESFRKLGIAKMAKALSGEMYANLIESTGNVAEGSLTPIGKWIYYTRDTIKTTAPSYWRYPVDGDETQSQLIFDEEAESKRLGGYIIFGNLQVSDDGNFAVITYCIDESEEYILQVRRIEDGKILCETKGISGDPACGDVPDFNGQGDAVTYMRRGNSGNDKYLCYREFYPSGRKGWRSKEVRIYSEARESFYIGRSTSCDDKWVVLSCESGTETETLLFDRANLKTKFLRFADLVKGLTYSVDILGNRAFITTDLIGDPTTSPVACDEVNLYTACLPDMTGKGAGKKILCPPSTWVKSLVLPKGVILESYQLFDTFTAFGLRYDGLPRVAVASRDEYGIHGEPVQLGEPYQTLTAQVLSAAPDHDSTGFQVTEYGMHQELVYEVKVEVSLSGELTWEKEIVPMSQISKTNVRYPNSLEHVVASDGASVPIALWRPLDKPIIGTNLIVYGAYGESHKIEYALDWKSLLDHGVAIAVVYARGGGELGRRWYSEGKLRNKYTTITDTLSAAQWLRENGLAGEDGKKIVLHGASAGGIAIGGALNATPEGFAGVVAEVPFVDCLTTMLDPTTPLTESEYPEWGNPSDNKADWESIRSWSPVDNIRKGIPYPPVFVVGALKDVRVGVWESARWVLNLRKNNAHVYLRTNEMAGHLGNSNGEDARCEAGEMVAFMLWCLGWTNKKSIEGTTVSKKALVRYPG